mmetsp:Transcript_3451/g.2860  ORF Transcript_3451/g.2860 Transcript_3451/m.2860 type:complete len:232 (-) Transcript_3451:174-869(-)
MEVVSVRELVPPILDPSVTPLAKGGDKDLTSAPKREVRDVVVLSVSSSKLVVVVVLKKKDTGCQLREVKVAELLDPTKSVKPVVSEEDPEAAVLPLEVKDGQAGTVVVAELVTLALSVRQSALWEDSETARVLDLLMKATHTALASPQDLREVVPMERQLVVDSEVVGRQPEAVDKRAWLEVSEAEKELEPELDKLLEEPLEVVSLTVTLKCTGCLSKLQRSHKVPYHQSL